MAKTKVVLNSKGVQELMKSPEMQGVLQEYANNAVSSLGKGYEASLYIGKTRANVSVGAVSKEAQRENRKNNSIIKAVFS